MEARSGQLAEYLIAITRALAGHTDPGEAFSAAARQMWEMIAYDHMDIAVILPDSRMLVCYEVGPRTSWSDLKGRPTPIDSSPLRLVLQKHVPFLLSADAQKDERFHFVGAMDEPIFSAELRSRIIVPMQTGGSLIGTLNISRHQPDLYTQADVETAQLCADFLTPYLAALLQAERARQSMLSSRESLRREIQLRKGASQLTEDMDRETRRLAMDLHDQTLADLSRVARHVAALRFAGSASKVQLEELESVVNKCLGELRRIVDDIRPNLLQLFGLREALEAHLYECAQYSSHTISFCAIDHSRGAVDRISEQAQTALYRIAQEAINNAAKHAAPSRIDVDISLTETGFRIVVSDDGSGIKLDDAGAGPGGISNMVTRATLIGAQLNFASAPGNAGTRVLIDYVTAGPTYHYSAVDPV